MMAAASYVDVVAVIFDEPSKMLATAAMTTSSSKVIVTSAVAAALHSAAARRSGCDADVSSNLRAVSTTRYERVLDETALALLVELAVAVIEAVCVKLLSVTLDVMLMSVLLDKVVKLSDDDEFTEVEFP